MRCSLTPDNYRDKLKGLTAGGGTSFNRHATSTPALLTHPLATDVPRVVSCRVVCRVCRRVCHDISAFIEIGKLLREKVAQYDDVVVGFLTDGTPTPPPSYSPSNGM